MELQVIGWKSCRDKNYNSIDYTNDEIYRSAKKAVVEDIRKNGYSFGGDSHLYRRGCAPVFNNGKILRCSMREWGTIMADAWNIPEEDKYRYMIWYMDCFREASRPEKARRLKYPKSNKK